MPNWTSNIITMKGIGKAKELYTEDGSFDFNKIIPMPKDLENTISGGRIPECIAYYLIKSCTKDRFFTDMRKIRGLYETFPISWTKVRIAETLLKRIGDNPCMFNSDFYDRDDLGDGSYKPHDHHHTPEEIGEFYWNLLEKYGYNNWYDWSCNKWGTKWNACDTYINSNDSVSFNTAWCAPEPIFAKLSEMYPNTAVHTESYYEDGGCWINRWLNGKNIYEKWEDDEEY